MKRADRSWVYKAIQYSVRALFRCYFNHQSLGTENVPKTSGAILATNHASNLDPLLVGVDIPRPFFSMAKKSLHDIPLFGSLIRTFYSFPVRRGGFNREAIRTAVEIVESGNLLLMFPEGTRTRDGTLQKPRGGIGKIVLESGSPVVPGYVDGSFQAMGPGHYIPRPVDTSVRFGEPLNFTRHPEVPPNEDYRRVAGSVMDAIRKLTADP